MADKPSTPKQESSAPPKPTDKQEQPKQQEPSTPSNHVAIKPTDKQQQELDAVAAAKENFKEHQETLLRTGMSHTEQFLHFVGSFPETVAELMGWPEELIRHVVKDLRNRAKLPAPSIWPSPEDNTPGRRDRNINRIDATYNETLEDSYRKPV